MSSPALKHIFNELQYELTNKLAEGGMGLVYEAIQKGTGNFRKIVAIKLIREEYSSIPEFQKNFIGEARLVADLIHTNIVQTYHLGQIGGQYFMTMEFVRGVNLEQFIDRHLEINRQIPVDMAVFIASRVCRGLSYAHAKRDSEGRLLGIVHRDVNPKNVMLANEGDVKLTDFGIAKALDLMYNEEGKVIAGKDEYLSPEQASYAVTDARAPLPNALGVRPAPGVSPQELVQRIDAVDTSLEALTRGDAATKAPGVAQVSRSFLVIFFLYALVIPLVIGLFFLIVTLQKTRSLTVLRAIGARSSLLVRSLLAQVLVVVGLGVAIGTLLFLPLSFQRIGSIPLSFDAPAVIAWALGILALGLLSSWFSARRVLRIDPAEALTGGAAG